MIIDSITWSQAWWWSRKGRKCGGMREFELNQSQKKSLFATKRQQNKEDNFTDSPLSLFWFWFFWPRSIYVSLQKKVIRPVNAHNKSTKVKKRSYQRKKKVLASVSNPHAGNTLYYVHMYVLRARTQAIKRWRKNCTKNNDKKKAWKERAPMHRCAAQAARKLAPKSAASIPSLGEF